jgi:hypothetical protein
MQRTLLLLACRGQFLIRWVCSQGWALAYNGNVHTFVHSQGWTHITYVLFIRMEGPKFSPVGQKPASDAVCGIQNKLTTGVPLKLARHLHACMFTETDHMFKIFLTVLHWKLENCAFELQVCKSLTYSGRELFCYLLCTHIQYIQFW